MTGSCHCGAVTIRLADAPGHMNDCNCTLCTKVGALWGYFAGAEIAIEGETRSYTRADVERPTARIHFCGRCGATTHWLPAERDASDRAGVNMWLFEPGELTGIEVRYPTDAHGTRPARSPTIALPPYSAWERPPVDVRELL